jgi:hypothetical protein
MLARRAPAGWATLATVDVAVVHAGILAFAGHAMPLAASCDALQVIDGPVAHLSLGRHDTGLAAALCHGQPTSEGIKMGVSPALRRVLSAPPSSLLRRMRSAGYAWMIVEDGVYPPPGVERILLDCPAQRADGLVFVSIEACAGR